MIGDDVEADVCGARSAGLLAALVPKGKYRSADLERLPPDEDSGLGIEAEVQQAVRLHNR